MTLGLTRGAAARVLPRCLDLQLGVSEFVAIDISLVAGTDLSYEASLVLRYLSDPEIAAERYFELESGTVLLRFG